MHIRNYQKSCLEARTGLAEIEEHQHEERCLVREQGTPSRGRGVGRGAKPLGDLSHGDHGASRVKGD